MKEVGVWKAKRRLEYRYQDGAMDGEDCKRGGWTWFINPYCDTKRHYSLYLHSLSTLIAHSTNLHSGIMGKLKVAC